MTKHLFKLNGMHTLTMNDQGVVECTTCSLSEKIVKAAEFMVQCFVHNLVVDGAELKMIY